MMMARTKQTARGSTKSSEPPPPPDPPPQPKGKSGYAGPQTNIVDDTTVVRPTQGELVKGMGKLKKTKPNYNPVKVGRELFNSVHYTNVNDWYYDFMPLYHAKNALYSNLTSGDLVTIDLYGTDQVTDLFFKVVLDFNLKFPSLTKLNLSGCVHLTDQGVKWVCEVFTELHELLLQGCVNVTEKGLYEILTRFKTSVVGMDIDIKGSGVAVIPLKQNADARPHLKLAGCPLISPTLEKHVQYSNRYLELNEHGQLEVWKMLIINSQIKNYSIGHYLVEGSVQGIEATRKAWNDVKCDHVAKISPETRLNIIELDSYNECTDMFITESCIVVLTCTAEDVGEKFQKTVEQLTEDVLSVYSKNPNTVVVVCPVSQSQELLSTEELEKLKSASAGLLTCLNKNIETIVQKMVKSYGLLMGETESKRSKGWLEAALNFQFQQQFGRLWQHVEAMENKKLAVQPMVLDKEPVDISQWVELASSCVPWQAEFGAELIELAKLMRKRGQGENGEVKSRDYYHWFNKLFSWDRNIPLPSVWRGVSVLANRGMFTEFSRRQHNPTLFDNQTMMRFLEVLGDPTEVTDPKKPSVPCVGLGVTCWHEDSLLDEFLHMWSPVQHGDKSLARAMIRRLEKQNILIQLPCKRDSEDQERFVYVRYAHLPDEPALPLEEFWPRKKPKYMKQLERFYVMIHGMPKSFMCAIFRHLGKVFNFTLLWKQGVYFQTGSMDVLIHLTQSDVDHCQALAVAVRGGDVSLIPDRKTMLESQWSVFKLCLGIVDYVLIKMNIFAKVLIACQDCDSERDTWTLLNTHVASLLPITVAVLGVPERYITCKGVCSAGKDKVKRFLADEIHGPESVRKKILSPQHHQQFVDRMAGDAGDFLPYTKCFLCDRCADKNIRCKGAGFNGQTSRHCSCSGKKALCPECGICSRCTAFLAKVETTIMPGLSSANPFRFMRNQGQDMKGNMFKGNCVNCNTSNVILCTHPMTPEHFNYVDLTVSRGNDISFGLAREVTAGNVDDPLECCEVSYMLNRGSLKLPVVSKHSSKWIAKEGSHVAYCVRHPRAPSNSLAIDWDGGELAVDIMLDGQCIHTTYVVNRTNDKVKPQSLFPIVIVNTPSSFFLNAPGVWSERKQRKPVSLYPKQLVEYSFGPKRKACRLARVSRVQLNGSQMNVTLSNLFNHSKDITSVLYSGDAGALCIHPLGFHATKGYDLEVEMPVYKGTTKEIQSYRIVNFKMGEPELEKLLESFTPADYNCFTMNQSCGVIPYKSLVRYRMETDCSGVLTYPSGLYCGLAQLKNELNRMLFKQGEVSLSGAAGIVLPEHLPSVPEGLDIDQKICNESMLHAENKLHALCHSRASASETLLIPPQYELNDHSRPYWQVHFVNTPGIASSIYKESQMLSFLWAAYMVLQNRIDLPDEYSAMFQGNDVSKISRQSLCEWIHRNLLQQVHLYLGSLAEKLTDSLPISDTSVLQEATQYIRKAVEKSHIVESKALVKVLPALVEDDSQYLLMCPAHAKCTLSDEKSEPHLVFPMKLFSNYSRLIRCLELSQSGIQELQPEFFEGFPSLVHLDLSNNMLTSLRPDVSKCKNMLYLTLSYNQLTDLPSELASLISLKRLDISGNPIKVLPSVVTELRNLTKLYAMDLLLETLPTEIGNLEKLEVLGMNGNCLHSLPRSVKNLKNVDQFSLNGVAWLEGQGTLVSYDAFRRNNFPQWFSEHGVDTAELFINGTQEGYVEQDVVAEVNSKLYRMFPRLGSRPTQQDGKVTLVSRFPRVLLYLTNLQYLSLQYQGIMTIPAEIDRLTKLKHLILSHCPLLEALPAELGSLTSIKRLVINECPSLKTPPKEIQARGPDAVMAYLRRLQTGSVNCRRTKLMMVGLGGAGKTSLVKAMLSPEMKANLVSGEDITDGIDISSWTVGEDDDSVTFSVWDFAGQTVYYNTHQFFLSDRAIYMLLWNMRLGHEHAGLDFWLNSISVHAPKAPVFVVGTHMDQVSKWELPMEKMMEQYPCIEDFIFVSSYTGQGVSHARAVLHECALHQPYMGESISEVWLNFEKAVVQKREQESVVSYEEVEKMATDTGIFEKSEISAAVQFLHELGTLQHFNNEYLKDKVVVDPQWIVDVMACVVSVKDSPIKLGKLHHKDIGGVWKDYPESLHQWLLRLTEEYDLTFPLPDKPINLVPCLLPEKHDAIDWPEVKPGQGIRETKMLYKFAYLPAGLFNRAQVRLYQYSDSSSIWKTGSVLRKNGNLALVTQTRDSELLVRVQGPRPENVLFLVHEVFEGLISESFQGVSYDYQIPCPDCLILNVKDVFLFSASNIKRATELKIPFLQCTKHFHTVTLTDLHSIMPPDSHTEYDFHLATAVRGLTDLRKDLKTDIFISYCQDDLLENQTEKVVDPRHVHKDLVNNGFKCYFPEADKQVSLEQQALALRDCKVFMALVSDSYTIDASCVNLFLYARMTMKKPLLMVVLGQGKNWRTSKLGILLAGEVFVNMTQPERYQFKVEELLQMANEKAKDQANTQEYPPCFISYSWANSHQAVQKGSRKIDGALGYGDPRGIKNYLEENRIKTWIDVEQVGRVGLFEDIAEGLQHARVVVACVSDQYANSPNCTMEFRFATNVLRIPTVLAVVGTGNHWRKSEVGMLSLQGPLPEVNFQDKSEGAYDKLLQIVEAHIPEVTQSSQDTTPSSEKDNKPKNEEQKSKSFQELFELAQRKFLRQVSRYSEDSVLYPRLIVVDFLEMMRKDMEDEQAEDEQTPSPRKPGLQRRAASTVGKPFKHRDIGFKILCEHEEGWHSFSEPISAPPEFDESQLGRFSPYLSRILSLLKHSNQLLLNCVAGEEGQSFVKWMEELPQSSETDFGQVYKDFRDEVIRADKDMHMGQLARCHLPSGKTIWLCPEHQAVTRMTLLTNDVVLPGERHTLTSRDEAMAGNLHNLLSAGTLEGFSGKFAEEDDLFDDEDLKGPEAYVNKPAVNMGELQGIIEHTQQLQAKTQSLQNTAEEVTSSEVTIADKNQTATNPYLSGSATSTLADTSSSQNPAASNRSNTFVPSQATIPQQGRAIFGASNASSNNTNTSADGQSTFTFGNPNPTSGFGTSNNASGSGQSTFTFGNPNTTSGFGTSNNASGSGQSTFTFGNPNTTSGFGTSNNASGSGQSTFTFGNPNTTSGFGTSNNASGSGQSTFRFGNTNSTSGFGTSNNASGSGQSPFRFGNPNTTSGFSTSNNASGFGNPNLLQQGRNIFGGSNSSFNNTSTSGFSQGTFTFGTSNNTSGFGSSNNISTIGESNSGFGDPTNTSRIGQRSFRFGNSNTTFGPHSTTGIGPSNATSAAGQRTAGLFGDSAGQNASLSGSAATPNNNDDVRLTGFPLDTTKPLQGQLPNDGKITFTFGPQEESGADTHDLTLDSDNHLDQPPRMSGFGQSGGNGTGLFGQSSTRNNSLFGQSNTGNTPLFRQGNTGNTGLFGQNNSTSSNNLFGQGNTGSTGLFGQANSDNNSPFGQSNMANTGLYGQSNSAHNNSLFGQSNTGNTPLFRQGNTGNTGLFGQNNSTSSNNLFGQGNTGSTGLFGQANSDNNSPFGQSNMANTGLYGQSNSAHNNSLFRQGNTGSTPLFGQVTSGNTGLFGQSNMSNNISTTVAFGQSNTTAASQFVPHPPAKDSASSRRAAQVRERTRSNLERERTKENIRAVTKATLKAAHADQPQSQACTIL